MKDNFGALGKHNELYPDSLEDTIDGSPWLGTIAENRQAAVPKSSYLQDLDDGLEEDMEALKEDRPALKPKFWSDFNRMYYVPRTVHPIPKIANMGLEEQRNPWMTGRDVFKHYDAENSVMEQDLRTFLEECDNLQGFQVTFDNGSFGGFTSNLLESIRDELPKHPILAFPILSGIDPSLSELDENAAMRNTVLLDALCLRMLQEYGTQNVPLQDPSIWLPGNWSRELALDTSSLYETSAILSAHKETATLPLRYKRQPEDLADYCSHLNWSQSTKFSQLSGVIPFEGPNDILSKNAVKDFSSLEAAYVNSADLAIFQQRRINTPRTFAQKSVGRGLLSLPSTQINLFHEYLGKATGLTSPYLSSTHALAYPLPTSFPRHILHRHRHSGEPIVKTARGLAAVRMTSSVSTSSSGVADLLKLHARFVERCAKMHFDVGFEPDELRELGNELWTIYDGYGGDENGSEDELGEDEAS